MNNPTNFWRRSRWALWAIVGALALALGVAIALRTTGAGTEAPTQIPQGGHFSLIDQNGQRVTDADLAGKYRLIYFGYTYCPDVCPVDVQHIAQAMEIFAKRDPARANRVQPIFISVDPARDTPAVLKQFVSAFSPRLMGLTGTQAKIDAAIHAFGVKGYGSYAKKGPVSPGGGYFMDHTRYKMLYGPDGQGIAFLPEDGTPQQLADALDRWVK